MNTKKPVITDAEWEIMRVVWTNGEVTSKSVLDILSEKMEWKTSTVKTLLARLVEKEYLETRRDGKQFIYQARVSEEDEMIQVANTLFDKVCNKKKGKMLREVIDEQEMTQEDIRKLQELLEEKLKDAPVNISCQCIVGQCNCERERK